MPLLFLLGVLAFDLQSVFSQRRIAQDLADGAVLVAVQNLPFRSLADRRVREYFAQHSVPPSAVELSIDGSGAALKYLSEAKLSLARFFFRQSAIRIPVSSRAVVAPRDVAIFVDLSSYLAPKVFAAPGEFADDESAWGQPEIQSAGGTISFWPAAMFFKSGLPESPFFPDPEQPQSPAIPPARIMTQQCFNPALSGIKEAAIRLYDYFSASPLNSVAVLAGPSAASDAPSVSVVRSFVHTAALDTFSGEGVFQYFRSRYARDEYCLAAAESEPEAAHPGYQTPPQSSDLIYWAAVERPPWLIQQQGDHNYFLPQEHLAHLSIREIIWSFAARKTYPGFEDHGHFVDISSVIQAVGDQLIGAPIRPERASLAVHGSRVGFILLGHLPHQQGVAFGTSHDETVREAMGMSLKRLDRAARREGVLISLGLSFFKHPGNYPECLYDEWGLPQPCPRFQEEAQSFADFVSDLRRELKAVDLSFVRIPDVSSLPQDYVSMAALIGKSSILAR